MTTYFVGGSQRSGTTLLQTILCQDQAVNPLIAEAKYLRHLLAAYRFGKQNFAHETKDYFADLAAYRLFNGHVVGAFLEQVRARFAGACHLVLREPHLTLFFPELAELIADCRFLCVVRDPRDIVASMIEVGARLAAGESRGDAMTRLFASRDIGAIAAHALSFYAPLLHANQPALRERTTFVRYEDLVQRPAEYLGHLRSLTGLALAHYDPARPADTGVVDYANRRPYEQAWNSNLYGQRVEDSRVGHHAEVLTAAEAARVCETCASYMQQFGYLPRAP